MDLWKTILSQSGLAVTLLLAVGWIGLKIILPWMQRLIDANRQESKENLEYARAQLEKQTADFLSALQRRDEQLKTMSIDFIERLDRLDRLSHQRSKKRAVTK